MNRKASDMVFSKLIGYLLVIVVILLSVGLIFKADLTSWLRLLPDFGYNDQDKNLSYDDPALQGISKSCPLTVGKFVNKDRNFIVEWFVTATNIIYIGDKETSLLWVSSKKIIELDETYNEEIGVVDNNGRINVYPKWIENDVLRGQHPRIPSKEEMKKIDGAFFSFNNQICRDK